ncbi:hypothetical protein [Jiangella gansuensis]|uniref:hypothetical protein n=1 Tax=Jiangella gansuensis TaxID=281473 RepID=UPI0004B7F9A9|nr:hypothetical protein [Jiangella gansuensis]
MTETVTCAHCGLVADEPPVTWSSSIERGVLVYYCDTCSRDNLRAIEARLDPAWW